MCNVAGICVQEHMPLMCSMYTSVSGHIIECSEFIWGIYMNIVVAYLWMM